MVNISKTYHFFFLRRGLNGLKSLRFLLVLGLFVVACGWWVLD